MTEATASPVLVEDVADGIRLITLNRPTRLNALDPSMVMALHDALDQLQHDHGARVIVLAGAGRGFCAGADLSGETFPVGFEGSPQRHWTEVQSWYSSLVLKLRRIPQVVVAAVHGACAGGGFSIAMASDIRLASADAFFLAAQVNIGQSASEMGASWLLPRIVGGRATEILLTGRRVLAAEAERIGLVSGVSESREALLADAHALATLLSSKAPLALRLSKEAMNASLASGSLETALTMEDRTQTVCVLTDDLEEGRRAFVEKRAPQYRG